MASRPDGVWSLVARSLLGGALSLLVYAGLAAALVTSTRRIAGPPGWTVSQLETWFERQPVGAAFSALATIGLIVVLYLMVSTVAVLMAGVARAARLPRVGRVADAIAAPVVRRTLAALFGLGITVANAAPAHAAPAPAAIAVMTPAADPSRAAPAATMHSLAPPTEPDAPTPEPTWTIRTGDHLWGLAAAALTERWATAPTDTEIHDYLAAVIAHNRDRLAVPDHPDLVFPGQVFVRPPVPER